MVLDTFFSAWLRKKLELTGSAVFVRDLFPLSSVRVRNEVEFIELVEKNHFCVLLTGSRYIFLR
ncbi:hypothetical protein, partial [uncultured Chryseobacterium sp.]|uniref:hypothetical protein n=1 Tax=uncultured Chryseobacterium sp. TaxID=259322 RepID=UPI0025FB12C1